MVWFASVPPTVNEPPDPAPEPRVIFTEGVEERMPPRFPTANPPAITLVAEIPAASSVPLVSPAVQFPTPTTPAETYDKPVVEFQHTTPAEVRNAPGGPLGLPIATN